MAYESRKPPYMTNAGRDVLLALILKGTLLLLLYLLFFGPGHRVVANAAVIATRLVGSPASQGAP
jgi:hypothetical protein